MPKHLTDGKVTYIHGATPHEGYEKSDGAMMSREEGLQRLAGALETGQIRYLDARVTLAQLEAGENDPALGQPMPAAPSVRQYGDPDIGIELYYGGPVSGQMAPSEPDEYAIWGTDQNHSASKRRRINWHAVALWATIILMCIMILAGVAGIASTIRFQDFLQNLATGSK